MVCLARGVAKESDHGFRADVQAINNADFRNAEWQSQQAAVPQNRFGAAILLVAETAAFSSPDFPILVVDTLRDRIPFRCIAAELWAVENNLNLASMDWQDFTTSADQDEVFRGFSSPATLLRQ